ncbi:MAG: potassium transporter TrkG [Anaerovoracaceae bacterium]
MSFNFKIISKICAVATLIVGVAMIPALLAAFFLGEMPQFKAFLFCSLTAILIGGAFTKILPDSKSSLKIRDGYLSIISALLTLTLIGSLPYIFSGTTGFVDGFFESIAGFTTTSATVVGEYCLPTSLALWKATSHWIGGLCVLIYGISILPRLGNGGQQLATAETINPNLNKVAPKTRDIVRYILIIYVVLTLLSFGFILLSRIGIIESLIYSFGSISTAAVNIHPNGLGHYGSFYLEFIVSIFSLLSALSFVLYFFLLKGYYNEIKRNVEIKAYLILIAIASIACSIILFTSPNQEFNLESQKNIIFQVISFASTSGFTVYDYTNWPVAINYIFLTLIIIGGCSASTSGGFSVLRILICAQLVKRGFHKRLHPRAIKPVKIGESIISAPMAASVTTFGLLFLVCLIFSMFVLSLQNLSLETTFSAAISSLTNIGIGFGDISYTGNYAMFNPILKLFICFEMIAGRLGLFTVFILLFPSFWRVKKRQSFN